MDRSHFDVKEELEWYVYKYIIIWNKVRSDIRPSRRTGVTQTFRFDPFSHPTA